jgi:hypothetical protein
MEGNCENVPSLCSDLCMPVLSHKCSFITSWAVMKTHRPTNAIFYTYTIHIPCIYQGYDTDLFKPYNL